MTCEQNRETVGIKFDRPTFLSRLELGKDCTEADIRRVYLRLANEAHPDHGGDPKYFRQLQEDYEHALRWVRRREIPKIRTFFLSPWNDAVAREQQRRTALYVGLWMSVALTMSVIAWMLTRSYFIPILLALMCIAVALLYIQSTLKPFLSFVSTCGAMLMAVALIAVVYQNEFFGKTRTFWSMSELDPRDQLLLGVLVWAVVLVPLSFIGFLISLSNDE